MPRCAARGVRVCIGGPFNSGILATGPKPADGRTVYFNYAPASAEILARAAAIEAVCRAHGVSLKAAALQFPRAHPAVISVVPGARSRAEFDENLALSQWPIPPALWQELLAQHLLPSGTPVP
jgi:D-threo-aldose 1-dehydrogenase